MMPNIPINPQNRKTSLDTSTVAMYFTNIVESATMSYNSVFQLIMHSAIVNT